MATSSSATLSLTNAAQTISTAESMVSIGSSTVTSMLNLTNQLSNASADQYLSIIRSSGIPAAAEAAGNLISTLASFGNANDWRVRLSIPKSINFQTSPILSPLISAGGLVFPYTPTIQIDQSAKYSTVSPIHSNYAFHAFQNSDPGTISITAPMNVEDETQAKYWVACLHYLRSMTKMFSGNDLKAGNPPPIVYLNGYGEHVFKNIPVVVTKFTTQLPNDCDYIPCSIPTSVLTQFQSAASAFESLGNTLGTTFSSDSISNVANAAGGVSNLLGMVSSFGIGGTTSSGFSTHVPTKSSFTVTLQPVYSRKSVRNFSLEKFVSGGYVMDTTGYV